MASLVKLASLSRVQVKPIIKKLPWWRKLLNSILTKFNKLFK